MRPLFIIPVATRPGIRGADNPTWIDYVERIQLLESIGYVSPDHAREIAAGSLTLAAR